MIYNRALLPHDAAAKAPGCVTSLDWGSKGRRATVLKCGRGIYHSRRGPMECNLHYYMLPPRIEDKNKFLRGREGRGRPLPPPVNHTTPRWLCQLFLLLQSSVNSKTKAAECLPDQSATSRILYSVHRLPWRYMYMHTI